MKQPNSLYGSRSLTKDFSLGFLIIILLISILVFSTSGLIFLKIEGDKFNKETHSIFQKFKNLIVTPLWHYDDAEIAAICQTFLSGSTVSKIVIYSNEDQQLYAFGNMEHNESNIELFSDNLLYNTKHIGKVEFYPKKPKYFEQNKFYFYTTIAAISIISIFITIATWWLLGIYVKRPLGELLAWINKVENGDYDSAEVDCPQREIQSVVRNFSLMVDSIKNREQRIRDSEEEYRLLFENTGTATFVVEEDMTITQANTKCEELSGYLKEDVEGKMKTTDFIVAEESEMIKKYHFQRRDKNGSIPSEYEFKLVDKNGKTKNVFIQVGMIPGTKKSIASIIDITPQKEAEEGLRESEEKYRELANSLPQVVFEMDKNGLITFVNRNAFDFFGYKQDDFDKGLNALEMIAPQDRDRAMENIQKRLNGEEVSNREYTILRKDGSTIPVVIHINPIIRENRAVCFRGIMIDITDRKQAAEEKKKLETQLQQAQKMESIGTLAGGIAHDFNNILASILGYTELSIDKVKEADHNVLANLEIVQQSAHRAKDLVHQILQFSRQADISFKPVEIRLIVKEALKLLRASLPATIEIKQKIQPVAEMVMADGSQIHQVVMNLCTNAFHAMSAKGGILNVELFKEEVKAPVTYQGSQITPGTYVVLLIQDTGCGMDNGMLQRIFEPYFTTKASGEGTGLGLAVTNGIVKSHKGCICVESTAGIGSVFKLYFPIMTMPEEVKTFELAPIQGGNESILFVDDEDFFVDLGARILDGLGYNVITANGSLKALEIFISQPDRFDLVITDQTMPKMTGLELSRKLHAIRPHLPIIICTGFSEIISGKTADQISVSHIVYKPATRRDLALAVRKVLDNG